MTHRIHRIPSAEIPILLLETQRLARKARKLGKPEPTVTVLDTEEVIVGEADGWADVESWSTVAIQAEVIQLGGWALRAVIYRDPAEAGPNIVHSVDAATDPAWQHIGDICDHCGVGNRGRKSLVVVQHTAGDRRIVGTGCLADFLNGWDLHEVATAMSLTCGLAELLEGDDWHTDGGSTCYSDRRLKLDRLLAYAAMEVRINGWRSRTAAKLDGGAATADRVLHMIERPHRDDPRPTDGDIAEAQAAIAWARGVEQTDDYLANVWAVAQRDTVIPKGYGIACSIISAYQRARRDQAAKAAQSTSQHVGTVGRREVFCGRVSSTWRMESPWGVTTWVTVLDDAGNVLRWKCSGIAPLEGCRITGKATVKEHADWQGTAQTVLTRWSWTEA